MYLVPVCSYHTLVSDTPESRLSKLTRPTHSSGSSEEEIVCLSIPGWKQALGLPSRPRPLFCQESKALGPLFTLCGAPCVCYVIATVY
jgi:hypothetical protein